MQAALVEGRLAMARGELALAQQLMSHGLKLAKVAVDPEATAACHRQLAEVELALNAPDKALASLERAMGALERAGDRPAVAEVMIEIARVAESRGALDRARRTLEDAALMAQRARAHDVAAGAAGELGRLLALMGDLDGAVAQQERAVAAWTEAEDPDGVVAALIAKSEVESQRLDPDAQRAALEQAWLVEGPSLRVRAEAGVRLGWQRLLAGERAGALAVLDAVVDVLVRLGDPGAAAALRARIDELRGLPTAGPAFAFALRAHGEQRAAERALLRDATAALALSDKPSAVAAIAALYLCRVTRGDLAGAAVELDRARREARGVPGLPGQLRRLEGKVLEAIRVAQEVDPC